MYIFLNHPNVDHSLKDAKGYTAFDYYFHSVSTDNYGANGIWGLEYDILKLFAHHYQSIMNNDNCRKFNIFHAHGFYRFDSYRVFDFFLEHWSPTRMINQQDEDGNTPLHYACNGFVYDANDKNGRRFATLIKQPHILVEVPNDKGRTLFHYACFKLRTDVIANTIKRADVNLNAVDNSGEIGLHHMIQGLN